ncbi:MAG: hypothetical protein WD894_01285 [Pirellulales bacterium]
MKRVTWLFVCYLYLLLAEHGLAQDEPRPAEDSHIEKVRAELEKSIEWNQYFIADQETPLKPHVVMKWGNQARGEGVDVGLSVVWADETRPQVIASIYPWEGILTQEYDLLAREANVAAKANGRVVWKPMATGLEFHPFPEAPPPAKSQARRRLQLKELADRFQVTMIGWSLDKPDPEKLRLLPQPLYRYGGEGKEVIDGALFGYVMGTDPEAALMIEAFRTGDDEYQWQYAFVRQTSGGLEAKLRDEVVWTAVKRPGEDDRSQPHFRLRRSMPAELRGSR